MLLPTGTASMELHRKPSPHTFHLRIPKPYPKHSLPPNWKDQAQRSQKTDFFDEGKVFLSYSKCNKRELPQVETGKV